jgi:hypothetical protein
LHLLPRLAHLLQRRDEGLHLGIERESLVGGRDDYRSFGWRKPERRAREKLAFVECRLTRRRSRRGSGRNENDETEERCSHRRHPQRNLSIVLRPFSPPNCVTDRRA